NARALNRQVVANLVEAHIEAPQFGIFGRPRVNVLQLNMALDQLEG
ncbi:MAG: potassium-transporting ATPase subunit C, partial [Phototrophicales bacterium]